MQISSIDQLKWLASASHYHFSKFSRKEFAFLKNSVTIDKAGNVFYHHHERETPMSPKTKPSSNIGRGRCKIVKVLFNGSGVPVDLVRAIYVSTAGLSTRAKSILYKLQGIPHLLPFNLVWQSKIQTDDKGKIYNITGHPVLYMPRFRTDYENIIRNNLCPDRNQKLQAMYQMALGLSGMHQIDIVHRDIKPSNICVDNLNNTQLFDFDFITDRKGVTTGTGSPLFSAPEYFIKFKKYTIQQIKKIDVYSLGFTFYLLYANVNFEDLEDGRYGAAMLKIRKFVYPHVDDVESSESSSSSEGSDSDPDNVKMTHSLPKTPAPPKDFESVFAQFKRDHEAILLSQFNTPNADDMMKFIGRMLSWDPENRPDIDVVLGEINKELLKCY